MEKCCTSCGETKALELFVKASRRPDGRGSYCKECHRKISRESKQRHPESRVAYREYYNDVYGPQYRAKNREKLCDATKERWRRDIGASRERAREQHRKHREQERARWQRYRVASADKLAAYRERTKDDRRIYNQRHRAEKRDYYRDKGRAWRRQNLDRARAITQRRRARRRGNGGSYTATEWRSLCRKYDYRCLCCGKREPDISLTVDHVVPLDKGGANDITNLQPLCGECNSRKGATIIDYRPENPIGTQCVQLTLF